MSTGLPAGYAPAKDLLRERVILVTGAASGIGRAVALAYARLGAAVILLDRETSRLESLYDEIVDKAGAQPALYPMNLAGASGADYEQLAARLDEEFGRLDGLLSNAAWVGGLSPIKNHEVKRWTECITVNLHAPFLLIRALLPLLEKSADPAILFSTDHCANAFWAGYGAAKAGLNGLLSILAEELDGVRPIRVNGIDTGPVRTRMRTENYPGVSPEVWPSPESFVPHYVFLMGPDSRGITGENWRLVD